MNIKELDLKAKHNEPMPQGLAMYEQCYYITSRSLYQQYATGQISLSQAKEEKAQAIKLYEEGKGQYELFMGLFEIEDKLKQLKADGFNSVLEFEILDLINELLK